MNFTLSEIEILIGCVEISRVNRSFGEPQFLITLYNKLEAERRRLYYLSLELDKNNLNVILEALTIAQDSIGASEASKFHDVRTHIIKMYYSKGA